MVSLVAFRPLARQKQHGQKGVVEERCSTHSTQEAEMVTDTRKNGLRTKYGPKDHAPMIHSLQLSPTSFSQYPLIVPSNYDLLTRLIH